MFLRDDGGRVWLQIGNPSTEKEVSLRSVMLMVVMRWMQWQWRCSVVLARLGLGHASVMDRIIISINIRSW